MKLATIRESRTDRPQQKPAATGTAPRDTTELDELFEQGMRALRARDDERAYRIFTRICRYDGDDAPPGLLPSARASRDFLDPDRTPGQKAETLFGFFNPTTIRLDFDGDALGRRE